MSEQIVPIRRVLASVTNKAGLPQFATRLQSTCNPSWIASGGTAALLDSQGIAVDTIESYTGAAECFGGRIKTLHPKVVGGILYRRGIDDLEAEQLNCPPIDLILCNFYDFEKAVESTRPFSEMLESMDIGGPTLVRSASKNYQSIVVVVDPTDYGTIIDEIETRGGVTLASRERLAAKAIHLCACYDAMLSREFFRRTSGEESQLLQLRSGRRLRYGENPDQEGWLYCCGSEGLAQGAILCGKEPSYNNYEDASVAVAAVGDLRALGKSYSVAVVKHGSLCGCAAGCNLARVFARAWEGDSKSAFGSVIGIDGLVDESLIPLLESKYVEVIVASQFAEEFVQWAKERRPNLRLIEAVLDSEGHWTGSPIPGGMLLQSPKRRISVQQMESLLTANGIVTKTRPHIDDPQLFAFAVAVVRHAKSNAVAIVRAVDDGYQLLGMGAGQPNRIDSLQRLAVPKAREVLEASDSNATTFDGCVLASDGFFPFDDSIRYAASVGLKQCVQPGGSKRDDEVVQAADQLGVCMVFTGERYFSH